jgi:RNA polymerase sigma factor (sigma-70 family)
MTNQHLNEHLKAAELTDLKQLVAALPQAVPVAVRGACLRHHYPAGRDELADLCQQLTLLLIEQDCRRLCLFDRQQASFLTWLQAVAMNYVGSHLQRQQRPESLEALDPEALICPPTQEEEVMAEERRQWLRAASGKLTSHERQFLMLCCEFELSAAAIAGLMKIKVESVHRRKHALIEKLRRLRPGN